MPDIEQLKHRFQNDPTFHTLVAMLVTHLHEHAGQTTATELREAAMLASAIHDERHVAPLRWLPGDARGGA